MALPGVRTILKDRFDSITRSSISSAPRVALIAPRAETQEADPAPPDFVAYNPRTGKDVRDNFGEGSPIHRAYIEAVSGGAPRISLIPLPWDTNDDDIMATGEDSVTEIAFREAERVQPDIIVPWGRGWNEDDNDVAEELGESDSEPNLVTETDTFYAANKGSLAPTVARLCKEITDRTSPCFAVMGVVPLAMEEDVPGDRLDAYLTDLGFQSDKDDGHFLSVVATELKIAGYDAGWGYSNGAAQYAGQVAQMNAETATTGRSLFNVVGMRYNPTRTQQIALINQQVVPVAQNFSRVPVWIDGVTWAESTSDYTRLTTLRIIFEAVQRIRQQAETFVGKPSTMHHRNALDTAVTSSLREMTIGGALLGSDHDIDYLPRESKAIINLSLQPAFEMRVIEISVSVQF